MSADPWGAVLRRYGCEPVDETDCDGTVSGFEHDSDTARRAAIQAGIPSFEEILYGDEPVASTPTTRRQTHRHPVRHAVTIVVGLMLILGLIGGGGYLVYWGVIDSRVEDFMPLPAQTYRDTAVSPEPVTLTGDVLTHRWPVVNADSDQGSNTWDINTEQYRIDTMSIKEMAPGSVFIPKAGIYAELRASDHFKASGYYDFQTLDIPTNVHRGAWYSSGAPLTGTDVDVLTGERPTDESESSDSSQTSQSASGQSSAGVSSDSSPSPPPSAPIVPVPRLDPNSRGTTLIASHVSWTRRHRGAFYTMSTDVARGELIWVKGFDGSLSTWRVNGMWFAEHEAFPKEYFSATGTRRLVLTTCGGRTNRYGYYQQNVFTVAVPVPLEDAVNSVEQ